MSKLDDLEAAIQRCDNLDWRIDFDEDMELWYAWFHPDWEVDSRRVIRVILADDEPSANEQACIQAMQLVMANAPAMIAALRAAREVRALPMMETEYRYLGKGIGTKTEQGKALVAFDVALADLDQS